MPQPFSKLLPNGGNVQIGSLDEPIFDKVPSLALQALGAIASWSKVELSMLRLFVTLMGGRQALSAAIYLALETQSAKVAAINVAANAALSNLPDEARLLNALMKMAKTNQKTRDKLAHWVWGHSDQLPDSLLLIDPRKNFGEIQHEDIYVYKERDLKPYIASNERLVDYCQRLTMVVGIVPKTGKRQSILTRLLAEPELAKA